MSQSKRELIMQAIIALMIELGVAVYRSPFQAIDRTEINQAACIVDWSTEDAVPETNVFDECRLVVGLSIMSCSVEESEQVADDLIAQAHFLLMADRTLSGLVDEITRLDANKVQDDADLERCVITQRYAVTYQHKANDLTS